MEDNDSSFQLLKRRSVLQTATVAGGIGMLPPGVTANDGSNRSGNSPSNFDNAVKLGDFETGMDGWTTNGGNKQRRITDGQIPAGVVNGRHGLVVEVTGDLFPMIENQRRVKNANFQDNPYLRMHVLTQAQETDSDLVFQFRLHHTSNGGKKRGSGGSKKRSKGHSTSGSKDVNVEESALTTVPQFTPREIQWDMSDLSSDVLSTENVSKSSGTSKITNRNAATEVGRTETSITAG